MKTGYFLLGLAWEAAHSHAQSHGLITCRGQRRDFIVDFFNVMKEVGITRWHERSGRFLGRRWRFRFLLLALLLLPFQLLLLFVASLPETQNVTLSFISTFAIFMATCNVARFKLISIQINDVALKHS